MYKNLGKMTALTLSASLVLAACSTSGGGKSEGGSGEDGEDKQVLNLSAASDIPTMNSALATDSASTSVLGQTQEGLYSLGKDDKIEEGVAEGEPEVSEDKKTYTIKLREDAKWSNGEAVTAKDFVFAWQTALNPETGSEFAYFLYDIKNAEAINNGDKKVDELGVKAVDDQTLEIELEKPVPYFQQLLTFPTFYPLNEKFYNEQDGKYGTSEDKTLYNGPFVLNNWETESKYQLTPNEEYWDKEAVNLDEVNFQIVKDVQTGINLYETGKIDITGLSAEHVDSYKEDENFETDLRASTFYFVFNLENETLKNENVRQAIAQSIDKEKYVSSNRNNGSKAYDKFTPSELVESEGGEEYTEGVDAPYSYNPEAAKKAWEKAKEELGKDEITIELLTFDQDSAKTDAEYFQSQLEQNLDGLSLKIKQQPFKQKIALEDKGQFDISFSGWGADYPDPLSFLQILTTGNNQNSSGWSNPEYDKAIESAKGDLATKPEERIKALQEAEALMLKDVPVMPLYQTGAAYLQQPYIKDYHRHKFGVDFSLKTTSIEGKESK
ncbi:peptide ABC transporter substrate-binding protein [Abyssicoccus albus]|uniref:peptide ABC transporter substrate-binding protein n=1 Tax=Abyssicoccus albus TaxID=1817405 RepID=UPI00097E1CEC|nr:peptide ABC transporter substrate-binding protein [Abyssicoccus albus]AQL56581.1 peptide ABC transporter substrate-binding protein [Abyssicoccus albus]